MSSEHMVIDFATRKRVDSDTETAEKLKQDIITHNLGIPTIKLGVTVRTKSPDDFVRRFLPQAAIMQRRWGPYGIVIKIFYIKDERFYLVKHDDGTEGRYYITEIEVAHKI